MNQCHKAQEFLLELKQLRNQLNDLNQQDIRKSLADVQSKIDDGRELIMDIENIVTLEIEKLLGLRQQYIQQTAILQKLNLLKLQETSNEQINLGFYAGDAFHLQFYSMPPYRELVKELRRNEKYQQFLIDKFHQGFTKLLIVPFGSLLGDFFVKVRANLIRFYHEKRLPNLDFRDPLKVSRQFKDAPSDEIIYYPNLTETESIKNDRPHGKTKKELLRQAEGTINHGFHLLLVEDLANPPQSDKIRILPSDVNRPQRQQLPPGLSPAAYLDRLQNQSQYAGEQGLTLEDWLTLFMIMIEEKNEPIDVIKVNQLNASGTFSFLLGVAESEYGHLGGLNMSKEKMVVKIGLRLINMV